MLRAAPKKAALPAFEIPRQAAARSRSMSMNV